MAAVGADDVAVLWDAQALSVYLISSRGRFLKPWAALDAAQTDRGHG